MVAPVIPAINDMEIERILDAAAAAGAKEAGYVLLRLPLEVRDLFREWVTENFPDRARHVFKLIRDMRGGKDYDAKWGERMTGSGPIAWMIGRRFEAACERLGLNRRKLKLTTEHFAPTRKRPQQLSLALTGDWRPPPLRDTSAFRGGTSDGSEERRRCRHRRQWRTGPAHLPRACEGRRQHRGRLCAERQRGRRGRRRNAQARRRSAGVPVRPDAARADPAAWSTTW